MGRIGVERKRAVNRARSRSVLSSKKRHDLASHPKSIGVIPARLYGTSSQSHSLVYVALGERGPTVGSLDHAAPADQSRGGRVGGIQFERPQ